METRKVYRSGGSTFVVSLPKRWATKAGVREGDSLVVSESEGFLTLSTGDLDKGPTEAVIDAGALGPKEDLKLLIISHYLAGYDKIVVRFEGRVRLEFKKEIREIIGFLMGLEIAEEYEDYLVLEVYLDQDRIPTLQALKRMYLIVKSMLKDSLETVRTKNASLAHDVIAREGEVDRLYFLIVRQLKSAVRFSSSAQRLGISEQREALGYRIVVKSFERIADHIENLISNYVVLVDEPIEVERVEDMLNRVIAILDDSSRSVFKKDQVIAAGVFPALTEVKKVYDEASNHIFSEELSRGSAIHYKGLLDSISRIGDYSSDIAEIAINMSVMMP
jgi:phosphate uptake regulator